MSHKQVLKIKQVTILIVLLIFFTCQSFGNHIIISNSYKEEFNTKLLNKTMLNDTINNVILSYLKFYESKDLKGIENIFSEDIILRDWKIRVIGKESALAETKKNFESVHSIKIKVISLYQNENSIAAELKITLNESEELYVVDIITINSHYRINSIKAFIGRGD